MKPRHLQFAFLLLSLSALQPLGLLAKELPQPVTQARDGSGKLNYAIEPNGDRVVDFSHAGYGGGGVAIPDVPARVSVSALAAGQDSGPRIQAAIDYVSSLAPDANGIRGAVMLLPGRFEITGQLKITTSGVVLRGAGEKTVLFAVGTDRRAVIEIAGKDIRTATSSAHAITDDYVPVGSDKITVAKAAASGFKAGLRVTIERPSTAEWIASLGMAESPARQPYLWKAGAFNIKWDRVITAIEGDTLTLDAPITTALDKKFGGAIIVHFEKDLYNTNNGVENLVIESAYDTANPLDEQHAWNAIDLHAVRDAWISGVVGKHFAGTVVQVGARTARVTVQDCASLAPVSEIGGYRRMAFHTRGQQTLFLRCHSEFGRNDFTTGYLTAGPIAFVDCTTRESSSFSGSIGSWSSGVLFDNVKIDGGTLRLDNLETWNQGVGWSLANSVAWGSSASVVICRTPPGAINRAVCVWGQFVGDGRWTAVNTFPRPESLYRAQLAARLGANVVAVLEPQKFSIQKNSDTPVLDAVVQSSSIQNPKSEIQNAKPLALSNGWLTVGTGSDTRLLAGGQTGVEWWLGRLEPARAGELKPSLTRFAPGRAGTGLTDELPSVASTMQARNQVAIRHHYGLWYERRRIDHQMIRRNDSDVYPPFYELPWARSGQGHAWDGLSRYDLTKYNPWYFSRLHDFAAIGRERGLVLINQMYFQHNIIESGAHWVDFPWRPVNNINGTGFTEPPPFNGDTIKMADEFYDVTSNPQRRAWHRAYIRHSLAALADQPNVIQMLSAENTGPLHFMQFWLDVVGEWIQETGKRPLIGLSATKPVQDAILADPVRSKIISVVDINYWWRRPDGTDYAPAGGESIAPRQYARKGGATPPNAASLAAAVREYREKYPHLAIIASPEISDRSGWAFAAAGGSMPNLPAKTDARLLAALPKMQVFPSPENGARRQWVLADNPANPRQYFGVSADKKPVVIELAKSEARFFTVYNIDPTTGAIISTCKLTRGEDSNCAVALEGFTVLWLVAEPAK